jgi:hypothetical protein
MIFELMKIEIKNQDISIFFTSYLALFVLSYDLRLLSYDYFRHVPKAYFIVS